MLEYKKLKKIISIVVVIAFVFNIQSGIRLHSQGLKEWENQFEKAKGAYSDGKYSEAKKRIELIIQYNKEIKDRIELLGKSHLLLGAVHEQLGENQKAKDNYKKAIYDYDIKSIEGLDPGNLPLYQKILKEKTEQENRKVIEKEGPKKGKKKFPILLVVGGIAVIGVVVYLLTRKKEKKQYTLTVNVGEGVEGTPQTGTTTYEEGTVVNYNYTLSPGYNNLMVQLDGTEASSFGTITINQNHTLTAAAATNVVNFVTDPENEIEISEGDTAPFKVQLSAQPTADVIVTIARESGDTDISVISGGTLTFTTSNWNTYQEVTLQAAQDDDTANGQATIIISAPGIPQKTITVTEQDDDEAEEVKVKILKPANGTEVTMGITLDIEASASSTIGDIDRVEFFIDNRLIAADRNPPYKIAWDTTSYLAGSHIIRADAYSETGKKATHQITVTVLPLTR